MFLTCVNVNLKFMLSTDEGEQAREDALADDALVTPF